MSKEERLVGVLIGVLYRRLALTGLLAVSLAVWAAYLASVEHQWFRCICFAVGGCLGLGNAVRDYSAWRRIRRASR